MCLLECFVISIHISSISRVSIHPTWKKRMSPLIRSQFTENNSIEVYGALHVLWMGVITSKEIFKVKFCFESKKFSLVNLKRISNGWWVHLKVYEAQGCVVEKIRCRERRDGVCINRMWRRLSDREWEWRAWGAMKWENEKKR